MANAFLQEYGVNMICKNCERCVRIGNTEEAGQGICSFPNEYIPVDINSECLFAPKPYTCGDCDRLDSDAACMTCRAEDSAYHREHLCGGFIDKKEVAILDGLIDWKLRGYDVKQKLEELIQEASEYETPFVPKGES